MTGEVIPLRSGKSATSALARFDVAAAELLRQGPATTLTEARFEAVLADLHAKRAEIIKLIADLRCRTPSSDARINSVNATLVAEAGKGLAHIDSWIACAQVCAEGID